MATRDDTFDHVKAVDPQEKFVVTDAQEVIDFPKPGAKPAERKTRTRKAATRPVNLETRIAAQLISFNLLFQLSPWASDALSVDEIQALAHALNSQAQASKRFKDALELALSVGSSGELISVVLLIAVRRAANHNLIPAEFAVMAGGLVVEQENEPTEIS